MLVLKIPSLSGVVHPAVAGWLSRNNQIRLQIKPKLTKFPVTNAHYAECCCYTKSSSQHPNTQLHYFFWNFAGVGLLFRYPCLSISAIRRTKGLRLHITKLVAEASHFTRGIPGTDGPIPGSFFSCYFCILLGIHVQSIPAARHAKASDECSRGTSILST